MKRIVVIQILALLLHACTNNAPPKQPGRAGYLDYSGRDDVLGGGVKLIPVKTPKGTFHVWTKRVGNNPTMKVLLLHGGPAATHEYFEAFDSYFPAAGIEYYYYDQLGSFYSDQPDEAELWDLPRFVDEVDQVRQAFLDKEITGDVEAFVKQELKAILAAGDSGLRYNLNGPTVIMIAGVNGSGKTTSIAKLARRLQEQGKKVMVAACDTFRAAAVEQLTIWSGSQARKFRTKPREEYFFSSTATMSLQFTIGDVYPRPCSSIRL